MKNKKAIAGHAQRSAGQPPSNMHKPAKQGKNDFANLGYGGPAPPKGNPHRYYFKLYALDKVLDLSPGATRDTTTCLVSWSIATTAPASASASAQARLRLPAAGIRSRAAV